MKEWVLASHNQGKCKEFNSKLANHNVTIRSLSEFTDIAADEPACTFVENAILKARYGAKVSGLPSLADDSGLCVPALGGAPGVYSARYAGESCIDQNNIDKLLIDMTNFEGKDRAAFFITVLVLVQNPEDPTPLIVEGRLHGEILKAQVGDNGFGYDPVFYVPSLDKTTAQLTLDQKNQISHRAQAINKLFS